MSTPSEIVLSALEEAQEIMRQWFVPEGISAELAMNEIVPVLDNGRLMDAQRDMHIEIDKVLTAKPTD